MVRRRCWDAYSAISFVPMFATDDSAMLTRQLWDIDNEVEYPLGCCESHRPSSGYGTSSPAIPEGRTFWVAPFEAEHAK